MWLLLATKFLGTVMASAILRVIYENGPQRGTVVALVIAVLQFCLLLFLFLR